MIKTLHGIICGKTIELTNESGLPDGQRVEITVRPEETSTQPWGEGLRRCAGILAGSTTDDDDRILEQLEQERRSDGRPELAE